MFKWLKRSWSLAEYSLAVFKRYPILFLPLLGVWLMYALIMVYFKDFFNWSDVSRQYFPWAIFYILFFVSLFILLSYSFLLEFIQQIESGQEPKITNVALLTYTKNFLGIFFLAFIWTLLYILLTAIELVLFFLAGSKRSKNKNAIKTSISYQFQGNIILLFSFIQKGLRMLIFLIMPAIVWEDKSVFESFRRGKHVFEESINEFAANFLITDIIFIFIILPVIMVFITGGYVGMSPDLKNAIVFLVGFVWLYSLYLEQFFSAELFLWNIKREKEERFGKKVSLSKIPRPSLLNGIPEM